MNNNKLTLLKLEVLLAVFLIAPTWNHHGTVLALSTTEKSCTLDETKYSLEPKEEIIKSITNLTDGVYSFELSTVRTGCATSGNGRNGMVFCCICYFLRVCWPGFARARATDVRHWRLTSLISPCLQITWDLTTGPARRPWPRRKPPAQ